jgi:hypothetical protein
VEEKRGERRRDALERSQVKGEEMEFAMKHYREQAKVTRNRNVTGFNLKCDVKGSDRGKKSPQ